MKDELITKCGPVSFTSGLFQEAVADTIAVAEQITYLHAIADAYADYKEFLRR
jgi:hypothetical protein